MKTPSTLSIGGATYDVFVFADHSIIQNLSGEEGFVLPLGTKIKVNDVHGHIGGGAANTSVGLARLGMHAGFCGILGDDQWGTNIRSTLTKEAVDLSYTTIVEGEMSSFAILLSAKSGERVTLYEPGTNIHLKGVTFPKDILPSLDWIILNHIPEEGCSIQQDIIDALLEVPIAKLTWSPGGSQLKRGCTDSVNTNLLKKTACLILNEREAKLFTGNENATECLKTLMQLGPTHVCITQGVRGVLFSDGKQIYHQDSMKTDVVDTTGAGDAFTSAVTWGLLQGFDLPKCVLLGTINSASVLQKIGAQTGLLSSDELLARAALNSTSLSSTPLHS